MALSTISGTTGITDATITSAKLADFSAAVDLNGVELLLDADADTSITADTDDRIDFKLGGVEHISLNNSSGDTVIKPMVDGKDIVFQQYDGNKILEINDGNYVAISGAAAGPGELRFYEDTDLGSHYTGLKAGNATASISYILPLADGTDGYQLTTDGSGTLSWAAAGTTLSGSTNNTVVTVTGANALAGEGNLTFDGSTLAVTGALTVSTDASVGDDLTLVSDAAVLNFGADSDVSLTHVHNTGLLLNSTMAIQFNDASQYINAPSNAILDINATDEIELNATLVDINANVEISGTATTTGVHTFTAVPVLPANSIDSAHYVDGSIDNAHIADDAIDSEHYADGSIDNAHIADDAIDSEHYAAASIDNEHLADNAVDTAEIADNAVSLAKMAGLARGKIIVGDSSGDPAALAVGSANYVLTSDGTDTAWAAASSFDADAAQVFNESSADVDFRVESNGNANMLFVDGGADRVGIGTGTPDKELDIRKDHNGQTTLRVYNATAGNAAQSQIRVKSNSGLGIISAIDDGFSSTSMYQAGTFSIMAASTSTGGLLLATESDHPIRFYQGAAEKCRITSAGLTFGGDTAAANALDDYEEGTWTASFAFGGNAASMTFDDRAGHYTKIGRLVHASFLIDLSAKGSSTGAATVTGLPFSSVGRHAASFTYIHDVSFDDIVHGQNEGSALINLSNTTNSGTVTTMDNSNFANTSRMVGTLVYHTS